MFSRHLIVLDVAAVIGALLFFVDVTHVGKRLSWVQRTSIRLCGRWRWQLKP